MEQNRKCNEYIIETVPKEKSKMFFSESYGYNEGYFSEIETLIDYCIVEGDEIPDFIYGTDSEIISFNAENLIIDACDALWEGAYDSISTEDIEELQDFLDKWCEKQTGTTSFIMDYNCKIDIRGYKKCHDQL